MSVGPSVCGCTCEWVDVNECVPLYLFDRMWVSTC